MGKYTLYICFAELINLEKVRISLNVKSIQRWFEETISNYDSIDEITPPPPPLSPPPNKKHHYGQPVTVRAAFVDTV